MIDGSKPKKIMKKFCVPTMSFKTNFWLRFNLWYNSYFQSKINWHSVRKKNPNRYIFSVSIKYHHLIAISTFIWSNYNYLVYQFNITYYTYKKSLRVSLDNLFNFVISILDGIIIFQCMTFLIQSFLKKEYSYSNNKNVMFQETIRNFEF